MPFPETSQKIIYKKNPLDRVICQLRFPPILKIDTELPDKFQESIRNDFPEFQEKEGPAIARDILIKLGAQEKLFDAVCDIIGHHHHPRPDDGIDFKVVYDSDRIANMEERLKEKPMDPDDLARVIEKSFLTESGRTYAKEVLLTENKQ